MTIRDEAFETLLGVERARQEPVMRDIRTLADVCGIGDDDPFWGVIAFVYARLPRDGHDWEALKQAIDRLDSAMKALEPDAQPDTSTLQPFVDRFEDALKMLQTVKAPSLDIEALAKALSPQLDQMLRHRRRGLAEWLGEHARTVVIGGLASLVLIGLLVAGGIGGGYAAGLTAGQARASEAAHWAMSPEGRQIRRWATLNVASLPTLLDCRWGGAARRYEQNGRAACYPGGSGIGYYLP